MVAILAAIQSGESRCFAVYEHLSRATASSPPNGGLSVLVQTLRAKL